MSWPESRCGAAAPAGLVLLTGGEGRRLGGPKHGLPHPAGGSWAGHLVGVFRRVFPEGPVRVLGHPVPEHPGLGCLDDPREGPARALAFWAAGEPAPALRWWVLACDQVRWTPARLEAWHVRAAAADPAGRCWVLAEAGARAQFMGGFLGGTLLPAVAASPAASMGALAAALPRAVLPEAGPEWGDVDSVEELRAWWEE